MKRKHLALLCLFSFACKEQEYLTVHSVQCQDGSEKPDISECPELPDPLKQRFQCLDGRTVFDANECGGMMPTVKIFCSNGQDITEIENKEDCEAPEPWIVCADEDQSMVQDMRDCPMPQVEVREVLLCYDGNVVSPVDVPEDCEEPLPMIQCADEDLTLVDDEQDCPPARVVNTETMYCYDGNIITDISQCRPPDPVIVNQLYCADGNTLVFEQADCPTTTFDCPAGAGEIELPGGGRVNCPGVNVITETFWQCLNGDVVEDENDCPEAVVECPMGSETNPDGSCDCPYGGTFTLANGLNVQCPDEVELPEECNVLQVTNLSAQSGLMNSHLTIGRSFIGPTVHQPNYWMHKIPILRLKVETCEGQQIMLNDSSISISVSGELENMAMYTRVHIAGRTIVANGFIPHGQIRQIPFEQNFEQTSNGGSINDQPIQAREMVIEFMPNQDSIPGSSMMEITEVSAIRVSDGVTIDEPNGFSINHTLTIDDYPCNWTNAPDIFAGDPALMHSYPQQYFGTASNVTLQPVFIETCTEVILDRVVGEVNNPNELAQTPQQQEDLTGIWWGNPTQPVFHEAHFTLSRAATQYDLPVLWHFEQAYVDVRRFFEGYFSDFWNIEMLPGQQWRVDTTIGVNPSHPRSLNQEQTYFFWVTDVIGWRDSDGRGATRYIRRENQFYNLTL